MERGFIRAVVRRQHKLATTSWVALIAAIVYTISPIDLIPELIFPVVGYVDDAGIWGLVLMIFARERSRFEAAQAQLCR